MLIKALLFVFPFLAQYIPFPVPVAGSAANGFLLSRAVTIDHTKVPNTDQANFPTETGAAPADCRFRLAFCLPTGPLFQHFSCDI